MNIIKSAKISRFLLKSVRDFNEFHTPRLKQFPSWHLPLHFAILQWAFGVTCWEIFIGGKVPYAGVDTVALPQILDSGYRMDKPNNAACNDTM